MLIASIVTALIFCIAGLVAFRIIYKKSKRDIGDEYPLPKLTDEEFKVIQEKLSKEEWREGSYSYQGGIFLSMNVNQYDPMKVVQLPNRTDCFVEIHGEDISDFLTDHQKQIVNKLTQNIVIAHQNRLWQQKRDMEDKKKQIVVEYLENAESKE